jgi:hypothetical protein
VAGRRIFAINFGEIRSLFGLSEREKPNLFALWLRKWRYLNRYSKSLIDSSNLGTCHFAEWVVFVQKTSMPKFMGRNRVAGNHDKIPNFVP